MTAKFLKMILLFLFTSCGVFKSTTPYRAVSSISDTKEALVQDVEDKLMQIHIYQVMAQKQLILFDEESKSLEAQRLYEGSTYLKLQTIRTQVEEIEHEIVELMEELKKDAANKLLAEKQQAVILKVQQFGAKSHIHSLSVENLKAHIGLSYDASRPVTKTEIENEVTYLASSTQYQVFEKNIEHLSYMLESKAEDSSDRFFPSTTKAGNITGNEFPSKVWSLTFDDGPKFKSSLDVLKTLKDYHFKATFFQLTKQVEMNQAVADQIRKEGMEIASHAFTHRPLNKTGALGLKKEITEAVSKLEKFHGIDIHYFRLPYGAGQTSPSIREQIAQNGLIHVSWNVDSMDWIPQTPEQIVKRTLAMMKRTPKDAGVLLFHDIHQRTAKALPQIMNYLKQDNRRVCTLNEIVTQMNEGSETVCPQK